MEESTTDCIVPGDTEISVEIHELKDVAGCLHKETVTFLRELEVVWDEIGVDGNVRKERDLIIVNHVKDLYRDILAEANEKKVALLENISSMLENLKHLCQELQTDLPEDGYDGVPLLTVKRELKRELEKYQHMYSERRAEIKNLLENEKILCHALGKQPKSLTSSPLPNQNVINEFKTYLEDLSNERHFREEKYLKTRSEILSIMDELKIAPSVDFEKMVVHGEKGSEELTFLVTDENMFMLDNFHASLVAQLEDTRSKVAELRQRLLTLWERLHTIHLGESPLMHDLFMAEHSGNNVDTYRALQAEIARCEQIKLENIKILVDEVRTELLEWWDRCHYSDQQRNEFIHFNSDCYDEDLLAAHEAEIDALKAHYAKNRIIYDLVTKWEQLWKKMLDLEHRANRPDRFNNRGCQLLREEKERNSVRVQLPKIEQELLSLVEEYEHSNGVPFKVYGQLVRDMVASAWKSHKENKHLQLSAKKMAREQKMRTPLKTPLKSPLVTSCVRANAASAKRKCNTIQLFGTPARNKTKLEIPKLQANGASIKRASMERRKRKQQLRKTLLQLSKSNATENSNTTDYNVFETELNEKPTCRSTLFSNVPTTSKAVTSCSAPLKTPDKNTNYNLRSKNRTPATTPGALPIIF